MINREQTAYEWLRSDYPLEKAMMAIEYYSDSPPVDELDISIQAKAQAIFWMEQLDGRQFIVAESAQKLFRVTDVKSIPISAFKCPFQAQYFEAKPSEEDNLKPIDGFFILDRGYNERDKTCDIDILLVGKPHIKDGTMRAPSSLIKIRMHEDEGGNADILDAINRCGKSSIGREMGASIVKFVFNCLLFINSKNSDTRIETWADIDSKLKKFSGKEFQKKKTDLKRKFSLAAHIGESIRIDGRLREYMAQCKRTNKPISVRFMVRGHWRNQPMGSESGGDRRIELIWILPHWKGSLLADCHNKDYAVENR